MNNNIQLPSGAEEEIRTLVDKGRKIEAVKRVRQLSGGGLREAKDYVDQLPQVAIQLSFEDVMRDHEGELRDMLRSKGKIQTIKWVRQLTGEGLKEAKDFVENIEKDMLL